MAAKATPATRAAQAAGVTVTPHEYEVDHHVEAYGEAVAAALGLDPDRVFKTLVTDVDGELVVAVVPVAARLDLKALAASAGGKHAAMADPARAEKATGYVVGGISPLGQRRSLPTVIDETVLLHDTVFVSGGRRGLQIEIAPADLLALTAGSTAAIAR
jgi:Cys-tRNA(Pro)/Cys-tRNA(Cys) deacylase